MEDEEGGKRGGEKKFSLHLLLSLSSLLFLRFLLFLLPLLSLVNDSLSRLSPSCPTYLPFGLYRCMPLRIQSRLLSPFLSPVGDEREACTWRRVKTASLLLHPVPPSPSARVITFFPGQWAISLKKGKRSFPVSSPFSPTQNSRSPLKIPTRP